MNFEFWPNKKGWIFDFDPIKRGEFWILSRQKGVKFEFLPDKKGWISNFDPIKRGEFWILTRQKGFSNFVPTTRGNFWILAQFHHWNYQFSPIFGSFCKPNNFSSRKTTRSSLAPSTSLLQKRIKTTLPVVTRPTPATTTGQDPSTSKGISLEKLLLSTLDKLASQYKNSSKA